MPFARRRFFALALAAALPPSVAGAGVQDTAIDAAIRAMLDSDDVDRIATLAAPLMVMGDTGAVAPLIQLLYWLQPELHPPIAAALAQLTRTDHGESWFDWMVWQQDHPEFVPYAGFTALLSELLQGLDARFARFLYPDMAHSIRLEEIVWGGVSVDGIPALDHPTVIPAVAANYLNDDDRVFGAMIAGQARAWPLRIMAWHEMVNDTLGGVPVSLPYCTLCGAGILFDGRVAGRPAPFTFGSSGLLWRSNKLMYDRQTDSLWNQFTGRPVAGALSGTNTALAVLPLVTTTWRAWRLAHPQTTVLSLDTGFVRDYGPGVAYRAYFASPALYFPAGVGDSRLAPKDRVFGLRTTGGVKAWPLALFAGGAVLHDSVGLVDVVLVGNAEAEEVRAYEAEGRRFTQPAPGLLRDPAGDWTIEEALLRGPGGRTLARLPGHVAYWFAWAGYFPDTASIPPPRP